MAKNDVMLLDGVLENLKTAYPHLAPDERFEIFSFEQLLKEYDLSFEELQSGWVDGRNDGGIDGLFIFLNGTLLSDHHEQSSARTSTVYQIVVVTCKAERTFKLAPINALEVTLSAFFDLEVDNADLTIQINEGIQGLRQALQKSFRERLTDFPELKVRVAYISKGESSEIAENVQAASVSVRRSVERLLGSGNVTFDFYGAAELVETHRRQRSYRFRLSAIEQPITRSQDNYIVLVTLGSYFRFICDENGTLRRFIFDSNVRDYYGPAAKVNQEIAATLTDTESAVDFWWLNNGITILAQRAELRGKELILENPQVVNGLQTSETLYHHFKTNDVTNDSRALLVKVVVTSDPEIQDRITKATNWQNSVDLSILRATDKIQRDIEQAMLPFGIYYERRKNHYRNRGVPSDCIVSVSMLAALVQAVLLRKFADAGKMRTRFMSNDEEYAEVYNPNWDLRVYPKLVLLAREYNHCFKPSPSLQIFANLDQREQHMRLLYVSVAQKVGSAYVYPNLIANCDDLTFDQSDITRARKLMHAAMANRPPTVQRGEHFATNLDQAIKTAIEQATVVPE